MTPERSNLRLSTGETLILVGLLVAAGAGLAGYHLGVKRTEAVVVSVSEYNPRDADEVARLAAAYGPTANSQHAEEWIVREFFGDAREGVFVDVGANDYRRFSNTYYLETALGWSGVAIEPQVKFADDYKRYRPRTIFVPLFVSDVSNQQTTLYVTGNDLVASSSPEFTGVYGAVTPTPATTTTLDDVLDRLRIDRIDFLSIDIELAEPQALAGFSIDRFRPRLVAIEAHPQIRQVLLDYFTAHDYALVGKYWRVDAENFWFAPRGTAKDP